MYQQPSAPQSIGGVLDSAIRLFKAAWIPALAMAVACAAASSAPSLLATPMPEPIIASTPDDISPEFAAEYMQATALVLVVYLVSLPFVLLFGLALIAQIHATQRGDVLGWRDALTIAGRRFLHALLCVILLTAVAGVLYVGAVFAGVLLLGTMLAVGSSSGVVAISAMTIVAVVAMVLLASMPVVVLVVYLGFALPLVVTQDLDAFAALGRSWNLVRGHWWRTLVILTIATFIIAVITILVSFGTFFAAYVPSAMSQAAILFLVNTLTGMVTTPMFVAVLLAVLHDLSLRRGGDDLRRRIEAIAGRSS